MHLRYHTMIQPLSWHNNEPYLVSTISAISYDCIRMIRLKLLRHSFVDTFNCDIFPFNYSSVRTVVEPVGTGTLCAEPINFPFNSGITNPIT